MFYHCSVYWSCIYYATFIPTTSWFFNIQMACFYSTVQLFTANIQKQNWFLYIDLISWELVYWFQWFFFFFGKFFWAFYIHDPYCWCKKTIHYYFLSYIPLILFLSKPLGCPPHWWVRRERTDILILSQS